MFISIRPSYVPIVVATALLSVAGIAACGAADEAPQPLAGGDDEGAIRWRHRDAGSTAMDSATTTLEAGTAQPSASGGGSDAGGDSQDPRDALQACTQTLSPGANVASAIASAPAGAVICLNRGNYENITLSSISKTGTVTLQSMDRANTSIGATLISSNHITFKNLTITVLTFSDNTNTDIEVRKNTFTGQLSVYGNGNGSPQHNIVNGNTFDGITACPNCREGRLQIYGGNDLIVSNNHFGNGGGSDGIQWGGYGGTVGPGNVFDGLTQEGYVAHIDSIQQYGEVDHQTIVGNYFVNDTVCIGTYDKGANITVTNNVFVASNTSTLRCVIDFGSVSNLVFRHNTVNNSPAMRVGAINNPTGSTGSILDNIFLQGSFSRPGAGFSGPIDHNLFTSPASAVGTNPVIGMPTFVGGTNPTTWAGYALTPTSVGHMAATDGTDLGATP